MSGAGRVMRPPLDPSWRATAETFPVVVWTAHPDGSIEFVNGRWQEMTGVDPSAVIGNEWRAVVHPDDLPAAASAMAHSMETGEPLFVDVRIRRASGEYQWVRSQAHPLVENGAIVRWFGVVLDVADVYRYAKHFQGLAQTLPIIVFSADATGWTDWYNERWYEYTGISVEDSAGWGWQAAHHRDDFLEVMRRWPDSIATGDPFEMEFRLRKHDGTFHWFLCRTQPLRDDVSGAVLRWYGSLIDIDAQKFAVERSKRVAETLQDVFLPKALPQFPNLRLDAVYLPAEKDALVGGDWYDAFELPDGRLFFSIGDVAGHGLDASATVGRLRQAIFTLAWSHDDPGAVMHALDEILTFQDPGTMVTAIVGCLDPAHTSMHYAIAGHPPPLLAHSKHEPAEVLGCGGPPLGVGIGFEPTVVHVDIRPHSVIALYTDGMTEFLRDVEATEAKLRAAVSLLVGDTNVTRPAKAVADLVFEDMPARDDAALLLMQFSPVDADIVAGAPRPLQRVWRFHSSSAFTAQSSRREVMAYLRRMAPEHPDFFDVELIVGEIFANTVRHAPGLVEVRVDWPDAYAILTVRDTGPGFDRLDATLPGNDLSESGRGIFLVTTLAKDVSVTSRHGHGTELRVILPIKRAE